MRHVQILWSTSEYAVTAKTQNVEGFNGGNGLRTWAEKEKVNNSADYGKTVEVSIQVGAP
jgi:hypothetical protein